MTFVRICFKGAHSKQAAEQARGAVGGIVSGFPTGWQGSGMGRPRGRRQRALPGCLVTGWGDQVGTGPGTLRSGQCGGRRYQPAGGSDIPGLVQKRNRPGWGTFPCSVRTWGQLCRPETALCPVPRQPCQLFSPLTPSSRLRRPGLGILVTLLSPGCPGLSQAPARPVVQSPFGLKVPRVQRIRGATAPWGLTPTPSHPPTSPPAAL